jgi:hypothetical protein
LAGNLPRSDRSHGNAIWAKQAKAREGGMKKKISDEWGLMIKSGYDWPKSKRISVYLFKNQIEMLEEIARDKKISKRHVFFEAVQLYIGTYLRNKEERERRP